MTKILNENKFMKNGEACEVSLGKELTGFTVSHSIGESFNTEWFETYTEAERRYLDLLPQEHHLPLFFEEEEDEEEESNEKITKFDRKAKLYAKGERVYKNVTRFMFDGTKGVNYIKKLCEELNCTEEALKEWANS